MFNISFVIACFPIKIGRNEQLFLMDFDDFSTIYLILSLTRTFVYGKMLTGHQNT